MHTSHVSVQKLPFMKKVYRDNSFTNVVEGGLTLILTLILTLTLTLTLTQRIAKELGEQMSKQTRTIKNAVKIYNSNGGQMSN